MPAIRCFCLDCDGLVTFIDAETWLAHQQELNKQREACITHHPAQLSFDERPPECVS